ADRAISQPPSKRELEQAKERYAIGLDFMADAPADLALWASRNLLLGLDADIDRTAARFLAVTAADCARVAARGFDRSALVVCGVGQIASRERKALKKLFS